MNVGSTIFVALVVVLCISGIESAKILSIFSVPSPSHYIFASALLKELAHRGHEITSVNTYPQEKPVKNFRDIFMENNTNILDSFMKTAQNGETDNEDIGYAMIKMCINIFEHPEFAELLKSPEGKFDLIIIEVLWTDSLYGLGQHFNAPMIGVSAFGTMVGIDDAVGNTSPSSIVPNTFLPYTSRMSLLERVNNFIINCVIYYDTNYKSYYKQLELYEKYFPNAKLSLSEARTNFSLLMVNQHHSLSYPRPYVTNVIDVGGLQINSTTKPLPKDIQEFLDSANEGAIYFSMGSNLKSKDFSLENKSMFIKVFGSLKQKVLWKFEDSELPNKPDNVLIKPWIPQHSVLAHRNVKVFISHGGLLSTTESLFFGKPILGIPMFGDQPRNIGIAVKRGFSLSVNFAELNEDKFRHALNELLNNPKYIEKAKTISSHFHDQPLTPMETAVYWVEYILKHGGEHLRNAGADMNVLQYYSLDVIGFLLAIAVLSLVVAFLILKAVLTCCKQILRVSEKKIKNN